MNKLLAFCVVAVLFSCHSLRAQEPAPATMPADWQNLSAKEFVDTSQAMFAANPGPTEETAVAVISHAWSAYLNNDSFLQSESFSTIEKLLHTFAPRRGALIVGETDEERETSRQQVEASFQTLKSRVAARLEEDPTVVTAASFEEFLSINGALYHTGFSHAERAVFLADWMDSNDWKELSLIDRSLLFAELGVDQLDRRSFSARWTGSLTAPVTGDYVFSQLRQYSQDSAIKLWVDGKLVLDSTPLPDSVESSVPNDQESENARFKSKPVMLRAGQEADFRVELVHDVEFMQPRLRYPMAVLLWEAEGMEQQLIPTASYSPASEDRTLGDQGLKGEYYSDTQHQQLVATRLDPGLQMIWNAQAVACPYHKKRTEILADSWSELMNFTGESDDDRYLFSSVTALRFMHGMTATQRLRFANSLASRPNLLAVLGPIQIRTLFSHTYMLPGTDHLDLIGQWGSVRQQPRNVIGIYPGWHYGSGYYDRNYGSFWELGRWTCREFFGNAEWLWDEYLELENGECNLHVAYMTIFSSYIGDEGPAIRARLKEKLEDETLTGDQRMTWLLARAYVEEVMNLRQPRTERGLRYVEDAFMEAESPGHRFWALQELVARLISIDEGERAEKLLNSVGGQFTAPGQQEAIAQWQEQSKGLAKWYSDWRDAAIKDRQKRTRATYDRKTANRQARSALSPEEKVSVNPYRAQLVPRTSDQSPASSGGR